MEHITQTTSVKQGLRDEAKMTIASRDAPADARNFSQKSRNVVADQHHEFLHDAWSNPSKPAHSRTHCLLPAAYFLHIYYNPREAARTRLFHPRWPPTRPSPSAADKKHPRRRPKRSADMVANTAACEHAVSFRSLSGPKFTRFESGSTTPCDNTV